MPSISNHICRVSKKEHNKFRSAERKHDGKKYTIRYGKIKGTDDWEEYEYFYSVDIWSITEAKEHCKEHDGIAFEAASKSLEGIIEFLGDPKFTETKMGKMISSANLKLINNAVQALVAILKKLEPSDDTQAGGKGILSSVIEELGKEDKPREHLFGEIVEILESDSNKEV